MQYCPLRYTKQSGRIFEVRYEEHIQAVRTNGQNSKYAQHIFNTWHTYGTIDQTLEIQPSEEKRQSLNTLERFHVYHLSREALKMNDNFEDVHNSIFTS
jgi:hypothetical protein